MQFRFKISGLVEKSNLAKKCHNFAKIVHKRISFFHNFRRNTYGPKGGKLLQPVKSSSLSFLCWENVKYNRDLNTACNTLFVWLLKMKRPLFFNYECKKKNVNYCKKKRYEFFLDNCSILTLIATFP